MSQAVAKEKKTASRARNCSVAKVSATALAVGAGLGLAPPAGALPVTIDANDAGGASSCSVSGADAGVCYSVGGNEFPFMGGSYPATWTYARYDLDVDGDTVVDFSLIHELAAPFASGGSSPAYFYYDRSYVHGHGANAIMRDGATYPALADALGSPDEVTAGGNFANPYVYMAANYLVGGASGSSSPGYYYGWYPNGDADDDRYIGLRFDIGGKQHTGWVRLFVESSTAAITVSDFGFDPNPVPEPETLLLMAAGAAPLLAARRRRREKNLDADGTGS